NHRARSCRSRSRETSAIQPNSHEFGYGRAAESHSSFWLNPCFGPRTLAPSRGDQSNPRPMRSPPVSTAYETISLTLSGPVGTITLNRPDSLNSLNDRMTTELVYAVGECRRDPSLRAVILTGAGRAFSSGQDLGDLKKKYADPSYVPNLQDDLRRRYN